MKKSMPTEARQLVCLFLLNSVLFSILYFVVTAYSAFPIYILYLIALVGVGLAYIIYNRGFIYQNVTPEMIQNGKPYAENQAFLEDCKRRFSASRWMLTVIFPLLLSLCLDIMYLFLLPFLEGLFQ